MTLSTVKTSTTMTGADRNWFALTVESLRTSADIELHDSRTISAIRYPDDSYGISIIYDYQSSFCGTPVPRAGSASITLSGDELGSLEAQLAALRGEQ